VRYNPNVNAIISINPKALSKAVELDNYFFKNNKLSGKLHCIPIIVKDNIDVAGIATTAGVNALRNSVPNKNALVVDRLQAEGAIFISKGNLAEFAIGSR
jgi:aspartyl-tRNA(Asn)/glutamyl-tRNA(Gln) amidotransferase subunit A